MSWLKSAVNKAVEVSGKHNLTRTVRNYADTVVHHAGQAVAGGAKILQDRMGTRSYKSFKQTVRRLEEAAIACRGPERVQLLRRWLLALKEIKRFSGESMNDKSLEEPQSLEETKNVTSMLFFDVDMEGEPKNFQDVFLHSQALEGITLSMAKREELLQFAQGAITGLKLNADVARLDAEAFELRQSIGGMKLFQISSGESNDATLEKTTILTVEVDKLKVLAESLANSSSKAEKRILDNRYQKEEALNYRAAKANEVGEIEKELVAEITVLEKQRYQLEAELKKVNISLIAANSRLSKTREERDQFDEASDQIVLHLKTKEDELSKSIVSCKVEADVVHTWINFLEDTWTLQATSIEMKEKQIKSEMISDLDTDVLIESYPTKFLEEEYLEVETKIVTAFSAADHMKELFYAEQGCRSRREDPEVKELFNAIEKIKLDFDSIERPLLEIEAQKARKEKATHSEEMQQHSTSSHAADPIPSPKYIADDSPMESSKSVTPTAEQHDPESELAKFEKEFGNVGMDYSNAEIGGWEFDELEQELRSEANK
ncbi:hypothetical protein AXF42_Ash020606 [Apostasia shenzhenica]|uniref:Uncharacterized protein n=1 Tax=Apostasia shenzhenica TaxID=1088818 RepID=A0A2I0A0G0_9ASPA|nr:hypothetical protein AXF42_Ash020606 [Apostasia shenzhenica]